MIARVWRGWTKASDAEAYVAYLEQTGMPAYRSTPGNRGAWIMRREDGERTEFVTLSFWDSLDAIRAFAGDDVERAVFYDEDDRFLVDREETVTHWQLTGAPTNRSAPPATVAPVLEYGDVRAAAAWLEAALGFTERVRIGEAHRAQLAFGPDGAVVAAERGAVVKLRVPDVDAALARAREHGGRVVEEPVTHVYGERSCVVEDPQGHRWELTQSVRDVEPEEWGGVTVTPW